MSEKIIKVIFFFVGIGVLLYFINSGIIGKSLTSFKSFSLTSSSSSNNFFTLGGAPNYGSGNGGASGNSGGGVSGINPAEIPQGFTADQLSPYFHDVRLGGVSYGGYWGSYGQITLYASNISASTTIDVTGWQIKTKKSGETIPQAVNVYDPSGLTAPTDIRIQNGDNVYLYSTPGPFNLRLNKCIGYIARSNPTIPPIPQSCPSVDRSQIQNFTGACQNYILSVPNCTVPDLNDIRIPYNDYGCRNYLANMNYLTCFTNHAGDSDFLSHQIMVWMGANVVDQYHDQVQLLDRKGLLVDVYNY